MFSLRAVRVARACILSEQAPPSAWFTSYSKLISCLTPWAGAPRQRDHQVPGVTDIDDEEGECRAGEDVEACRPFVKQQPRRGQAGRIAQHRNRAIGRSGRPSPKTGC